MEKKYTVLIVHNYYQIPGGEDTVVLNEKKLLEEHGHKVILYTRNNSELKTMSRMKALLLPINTIFNLKTYREIKEIIRKEKIERVHVHNTLNLISPSVYYAAIHCKIPVVQTLHNFRMLCPAATFYRNGKVCEDCLKDGLRCAIKHNCYRESKLQTLACVVNTKIHRALGIYRHLNYICLTEFNQKKLLMLNQFKGHEIVDPDKIFVKPNFTFDNLREGKNEYYLFIGRVEPLKGIDVVLQAFAKLDEKKLIIAGSGPKCGEYKHKAAENVIFKGHLKRNELNYILKDAKAVIVASQCYETFGMVVVEAYAAEKPVIVGDIGNIGALVDDGITGVKYKYDSPEDLVAAILKLDTLDIAEMGKHAYQKYQKEFSANSNYSKLIDIYNNSKI